MKQNQPKARVLAFYLPQFHPIPENDEWWGKGFTEWTNVGKAKPLFPGHYQPHVPADLGYYDLRVPETREAQAQMAREAGIEGFVYWHYWFGNGKRLLERPFNEVLTSGKPDFPFALAWANETWSGSFHGLKQGSVLIEQTYPGEEDYTAHFNAVLPAFKDKRYITCEGKPMFFIYKPEHIDDEMIQFIRTWRNLAKGNGLPGIYFVAMLDSMYEKELSEVRYKKMKELGFDAVNSMNLYHGPLSKKWRIIRKIFYKKLKWIPQLQPYGMDRMAGAMDSVENVFPMITSNWDHTPRSGKRGMVLTGATPEAFKQCLHTFLDKISAKPFEKRILLLKSWNEWAEGNYVEPDIKYGHAYLDALKSELYS